MAPWIQTASYASAVVAYALLSMILIATVSRGQGTRVLLWLALVSFAWALSRTFLTAAGPVGTGAATALEIGRYAGWLAFLAFVLRPANGGTSGDARLAAGGTGAAAIGLVLLALPLAGFYRSLGFVCVGLASLAGLVLVEQLYRRGDDAQRWALKHLCLGAGLVMAYDFYVYADALLFGAMAEPAWLARGLVNAVAVPLIAVSVRRSPGWQTRIAPSQRLVTDSVVVLAGGAYLVVMALAGYYIRVFGGDWGHVLQIGFIAGAGTVLAVGVFSGTIRARIRVLVAKHLFHQKYDYRREWLRFIATLSAPTEEQPLRVRAIRAIAQIVDSPAGMLWTRTAADHFGLVATWNVSVPGTLTESGDSALASSLAQRAWILDIDELRAGATPFDPRALPDWLERIDDPWLIVPLVNGDRLEGFVVLARSLGRRVINWEDRDLLKTAGREVAAFVALMQANEALIDARQFDAFNRLSAFVVHDLNNILAQLSLISRNAVQHADNPDFIRDALATVASAEVRMRGVLESLHRPEPHGGTTAVADMGEVLEEVAQLSRHNQPQPQLVVEPALRVAGEHGRWVANLEHLVRNAQQACTPDGEVTLSAHAAGDWVQVAVRDNGVGMDEHFIRERLFRPFATTRGNAGMGVGVFEVRQYVEGHGGVMNVRSRPGEGTIFDLRLPLVIARTGASAAPTV